MPRERERERESGSLSHLLEILNAAEMYVVE
jgi:hypothetical protein